MPAPIQNVPSPPRVVAISGIVFAVLYMVSLVLIRLAVPADPMEPGIWLADPAFRNWVRIALNLVPFTGIAFLWYMAVLRNRVGLLEDRFFATVFLGSGLLFVAMLFAAVSITKGLLDTFASGLPNQSEVYRLGRGTAFALMNTYGTRMAAVFMFVTSTIGLRTGVLALDLVRRLCAGPGSAPGHHRICLDRTGVPSVGAAGECVYPLFGLPAGTLSGAKCAARLILGPGLCGTKQECRL